MSCPNEDTLLTWVARQLPEPERAAVDLHLAGCELCRALVAEAAREVYGTASGAEGLEATAIRAERSERGEGARPERPAPAERLGRYVILEVLGRGAMGVVYAAYDPHLDRRVALKVIRPDHGLGTGAEVLSERLLREGRAMARLSHPNLVPVHDVGELDGSIFLALEYVEGETLRSWLAAEQRPWREVLAAFVDAGRGLAAAHRAGIVHRDFKPENVLVGADGRIRVADFGLARRLEETNLEPRPALATERATALETATGTLLGTPAYMSPEQLRAAPLDARSDQFSFAVALHEALWGQRPFAAATLDELRAAIEQGALRPPPRDNKVPARLRQVIVRALSVRPEDRFASMDALLAALDARPLVTPARLGAFALAFVAMAGLVRWEATRAEACVDGASRVSKVWSPDVRERVRQAFRATKAGYAETTLATVEAELDRWTSGWAEAHDDACRASVLRREQPAQVMELRQQCLDDLQISLRALVDALAAASPVTVEHAAAAARALPDVAACADVRSLEAHTPRPTDPEHAARVDRALELIAELSAVEHTGDYERAEKISEEAMKAAQEANYPPAEATAAFLVGGFKAKLGDFEGGLALLDQATNAGLRAGADEQAALAVATQVTVLGVMQSQTTEALRRSKLADALCERLGRDVDPCVRNQAQTAQVLARVGRLEEAERLARIALAAEERRRGPKDLWTVQSRGDLAIVLSAEGRQAEALELTRAALEHQAGYLGADHPDTMIARNNVGGLLVLLRRYDEAEVILERTLADRERVLGAAHPYTATTLINLAEAETGLGRYPRANELSLRALQILEPVVGKDDQMLWEPLTNLGENALGLGRPADAVPPLERALKLFEAAHGAPWDSAATKFALARALAARPGGRARAVELADEVRAAYREGERRFGGVNGARAEEVERWRASLE